MSTKNIEEIMQEDAESAHKDVSLKDISAKASEMASLGNEIEEIEKYLDENGKFQLNKSGLIAYSHGEYLDLGKEIGTFGYSVKKKTKKPQKRRKKKVER